MRILYSDFQYEKGRSGMLHQLPEPVRKWYKKMQLLDQVTYVSGISGYRATDVYVCLRDGMKMYWHLVGCHYELAHSGLPSGLIKDQPFCRRVRAIKLTNDEVIKLAKIEADKVLVGIDREAKANWTKAM